MLSRWTKFHICLAYLQSAEVNFICLLLLWAELHFFITALILFSLLLNILILQFILIKYFNIKKTVLIVLFLRMAAIKTTTSFIKITFPKGSITELHKIHIKMKLNSYINWIFNTLANLYIKLKNDCWNLKKK